jgi:predicted nucleotidyltransferase
MANPTHDRLMPPPCFRTTLLEVGTSPTQAHRYSSRSARITLTARQSATHTGDMGSDEALCRRQDEVEAVAQQLAKWASVRADVRALAMIGSWARGEGRLDSDLDILLLTDVPNRFTASAEWLSAFGSPPLVRREQFGLISERRVRLDSGLDVEFGIGPPQWASTTPIDAGTRRVAQQGLRSLFDPDGLLASLRNTLLSDEDEPIRIVSYEPSWTARFEQEKAHLQQAIGPWVTGGTTMSAALPCRAWPPSR